MKQWSFWLTDEALVVAVKAAAKARGVTLAAAVGDALRAWIEAPNTNEPKLGRSRQVAEPRPEVPFTPKVFAGPLATVPYARICRKCGHTEDQHWSRGCLAGCVCTALRFEPKP